MSFDIQFIRECEQLKGDFATTLAEALTYDKETISEISGCARDVLLYGTKVHGNIETQGDVVAIRTTFESIDSEKGNALVIQSICLKEVDVAGFITAENSSASHLDAGTNITLTNCDVSVSARAGGTIKAKKCKTLGHLVAKGPIELETCASIRSITSDSHISLDRSFVINNLSTPEQVTIKNSKIGGKLTCTANHLVINNSQIHAIFLRCGACATKPPVQILLLNNSKVKNVTFEGGFGRIILPGGSKVEGKISGGAVEKIAAAL